LDGAVDGGDDIAFAAPAPAVENDHIDEVGFGAIPRKFLVYQAPLALLPPMIPAMWVPWP
jgi:hypothetical protein